MRKKLDTRFLVARIKKMMQADEDVGKMEMAVPVLVSKALEMFLQDLCGRTYNITLQRGMKLMSSQHLKQCVHGFNHYDFLREIVSKVPDMGGSDCGSAKRRSTQRRRTVEEEESEGQLKKARILQDAVPAYNANSSTGVLVLPEARAPRGSSRRRRNGAHVAEREAAPRHNEDDPGISTVRTDEVGPSASTGPQPSEMIQDRQHEYPGWSVDDMKKMAVDPVQFALAHQKVDEEEEDYDNEEG